MHQLRTIAILLEIDNLNSTSICHKSWSKQGLLGLFGPVPLSLTKRTKMLSSGYVRVSCLVTLSTVDPHAPELVHEILSVRNGN